MDVEDIVISCIRNAADWLSGNTLFSNRVVDKWNCLSDCCVNSSSTNCFKKYVSIELEPETSYLCMSVEIVALYGVSLCLLMPSVSSMLMAVVNLVKDFGLAYLHTYLLINKAERRECILL